MNAETPRYAFEQAGLFARGWHVIALSSELAVGAVKALKYFDRELVLFRGEDGTAAVLDAYCPHLGAHLAGTGSRVVGNSIRCPFHGWQFDGCGSCIAIPYAKKIPERARQGALRSWPVCEHSGFIALWYDPEGGAPNWELPRIIEWNTPGWGDWRFNRSVIKSQGREIIENIVDAGHFPSVHGGKPIQFDNIFTPYTVTQESKIQSDPSLSMIQPSWLDIDLQAMREQEGDQEDDTWGRATYHGPAVMYYYTESRGEAVSYASWWLNYHVPVSATEVELTSGVIVASLTDEPLPEEFEAMYPTLAMAAFGSDVEVWQTKRYVTDPILCDGDGPINKLRKWYDRFYRPRSEEAWTEAPYRISSVRD